MVVSTMTLTSASSLHMKCPALHLRNSPVAGIRTPVKAGVRRFVAITCGEQVDSEGSHADPPKLEPFSQSRLSRAMRERSFLRKAEDALNGTSICFIKSFSPLKESKHFAVACPKVVNASDMPADPRLLVAEKCMVLEGEEAYECWEALFEYENIKDEAETECSVAQPGERDDACQKLERLESLVRQSGGVNSLIDNVRMVAKIKEAEKNKPKEVPSEQDWIKAVSGESTDDDKGTEHPEFFGDGGFPKTEKELQEEMKALMPESPFSRVLKRFGLHSESGA